MFAATISPFWVCWQDGQHQQRNAALFFSFFSHLLMLFWLVSVPPCDSGGRMKARPPMNASHFFPFLVKFYSYSWLTRRERRMKTGSPDKFAPNMYTQRCMGASAVEF